MQKYFLLRALTLSAIYFLSPMTYATEPVSNLFAVGGYVTINNTFPPLLAASSDGQTWNYSPDIISKIKFLEDYKGGSLYSISCSLEFCIAEGNYFTSNTKKSLTALSTDRGASWSYVTTTPIEQEEMYVYTQNTSCNSKACVIASTYKNKQNEVTPLISISNDKGKSWTYSTIPSTVPLKMVMLMGLDCTDKSCVAVGWNRNPNLPLIAMSKDQAVTWSYSELNLPHPYQNTALRSVKCKENICIAIGECALPNNKYDLLVLRSTDSGYSWSLIPTGYKPITKSVVSGNVSYSGNTWIISGKDRPLQESGDEPSRPLVLVSQDNGLTWAQPSTIISNLPPKAAQSNQVVPVNIGCINDFCAIPVSSLQYNSTTGKTYNKFDMAITQDRGITWTYVDVTPSDIGGLGSMGRISCNEKTCFTTGHYSDLNNKDKPFVLITNDLGKTWHTPSTVVSNLPADFDIGGFVDGTVGHSLDKQKQLGFKNKLKK